MFFSSISVVVEVSCGDYGYEYIDRMVVEVENGRCRRWPFQAKEKPLEEKLPEDFDPKQLKCRSTSWDQFKVLHNRRWKQMWRDSVMELIYCPSIVDEFQLEASQERQAFTETKKFSESKKCLNYRDTSNFKFTPHFVWQRWLVVFFKAVGLTQRKHCLTSDFTLPS